MAVEYRDYYKILGVDRKADDKTIKSAYRRLARKHHPDVAKGKDGGDKFKEIAEAYEVLSDTDKRRRYDTLGPDWQRYTQAPPGHPGGFRVDNFEEAGDFSDFFRTIFSDLGGRTRGGRGRGPGFRVEDVFGDAQRGPRGRGGDMQAAVEISLDEAFHGTRKAFTLEGQERPLDVRIPAGVRTGQRVRVSGEGGGGGGARGDLYLEITVSPHPFYEQKGDDILLELPITAPEAALGATIEVPTLKGKVSMKIPPATSSARTFRLRGYGMPKPKGAGSGDQLVKVKIVLPSSLTDEETELYRKLKELRSDNPRAYLG